MVSVIDMYANMGGWVGGWERICVREREKERVCRCRCVCVCVRGKSFKTHIIAPGNPCYVAVTHVMSSSRVTPDYKLATIQQQKPHTVTHTRTRACAHTHTSQSVTLRTSHSRCICVVSLYPERDIIYVCVFFVVFLARDTDSGCVGASMFFICFMAPALHATCSCSILDCLQQ